MNSMRRVIILNETEIEKLNNDEEVEFTSHGFTYVLCTESCFSKMCNLNRRKYKEVSTND